VPGSGTVQKVYRWGWFLKEKNEIDDPFHETGTEPERLNGFKNWVSHGKETPSKSQDNKVSCSAYFVLHICRAAQIGAKHKGA
jgi:hypothetical protein